MTTFVLAFVFFLLSCLLLGIGKLLTGKSKLDGKRCGKPEKDGKCDRCGD